uniref:Arginine vasopressin-induced protein 1 n=1 Tax=Denticeps clupeoides TaxID=299321 RepID=A0AAY4ECB1_9TELE
MSSSWLTSVSPLRRPVESRSRKSALHNIFQGVNLRQLRRLFHAAGEQDAEQHAKLVWGKGSQEASEADGENEDSLAEVESGLAQALVGLRVRARTRNGLRAEMRDGGSGTRLVKAFGHVR